MDALKRIEKKLDKLIARRVSRDTMRARRSASAGHKWRDQVLTLRSEKIALLKYIHELETVLKLQRSGDLDI